MILVIGSVALEYNGIPAKEVNGKKRLLDIDLIAPIEEARDYIAILIKSGSKLKEMRVLDNGDKIAAIFEGSIVDIELAHPGSNQEQLLALAAQGFGVQRFSDFAPVTDGNVAFATADLLYMLKMSHRYKKNTPFFQKTMQDIHELRVRGAKFIPELAEWYARREKDTYMYKHPKLNTSKNDFFNAEESFYVYDHDTIHEAVKHLSRPAYEYYKPDTNEVNCSKDMFFAVDNQVRLYGVLEESYVLALERCLIPNNFEVPAKRAFNMALEKVCTSITSGWFREFAWENYHTVQMLYSDDYVTKFQDALANGTVKPFTGSKY